MAALDIGLVQINNSFSGQNYLPYAVAGLQVYAERHHPAPGTLSFRLPLYKRIPVEAAVRHLEGADLACFSSYVWNERISLEVARRLKERSPRTLIVFGGPQTPNRAEEYLRKHQFIDIAAHGEGERTFVKLLEAAPDRRWREVPSISFLEAGALVHTGDQPRVDLTTVPSPYLEGTFEPLMRAHPQERWICLWETNRGCPFSCTFCDWGSATQTKVNRYDMPRLEREVEWFSSKKIEFIFCADANFGILPRDLDIVKHVAAIKARTGYPHALSVQNTKNATERAYEVQATLARAGLNKGVALSMQSTDAATLVAIKRNNIALGPYQELQRRFTKDGIETYSDLILGLPGETYDSFVNGVADLIEGGQHNRIQFNNLSILPNAEMGDPAYQAKYGMKTVESRIINIHGSLSGEDEIDELQQLVITTAAMPGADWVRTRALCWMVALLHFDKVLQVPLVIARALGDVPWRRLLEAFMSDAVAPYPVLSGLRELFLREARRIQAGGEEYCASTEWLGIWWPADEYALIDLHVSGKLEAFFVEAEALLGDLLAREGKALPPGLLGDAVALNRALLKLPGQTEDLILELGHNVLEVYRGALVGRVEPLLPEPMAYKIDRTTKRWTTLADWCREVIWWGNKKGAYLYGAEPASRELAGHF